MRVKELDQGINSVLDELELKCLVIRCLSHFGCMLCYYTFFLWYVGCLYIITKQQILTVFSQPFTELHVTQIVPHEKLVPCHGSIPFGLS